MTLPAEEDLALLPAGEQVDLSNCEREPIHLSGAIQPHGVLLAVRDPDLVVSWASGNTHAHLGLEPAAVLGAPLAEILGEPSVRLLRARLEDPTASGTDPLVLNPPGPTAFGVSWHRVDGLVVIELEPAQDALDVSLSSLFAEARQAIAALEGSHDLQMLCERLAAAVKHLTGYDRVMVYRFHPDDHGEVVAEEREPDQESYLGLHYPATDIPAQARRLFTLNRLRVIADVDYQPVPLLAASHVIGEHVTPPSSPDLTLSGLRSVSPMHIEYLRNMGVAATLTISLLQGTRLWGMLACHHDTPRTTDAQVRAACRLLGQVFSLRVVAQEKEARHEHRERLAELEVKLLAGMANAASLTEELERLAPLPVQLTGADAMVARVDGRTVSLGAAPPDAAVTAVLALLSAQEQPGPLLCDDLPHRFPELAPYRQLASGVLAVPLTAGHQDFVLWFRGERVVERRWAGDPDAAKTTREMLPGDGSPAYQLMGPRSSFEAWTTQVRGRCLPWEQAEIDTALSLAAAVPELLLARARDRLAHLALHDSLTGLPNRSLLLDRVSLALARRTARAAP